MLPLIMIPALCCDDGLYHGVTAALSDLVSPRIIIPYEGTLAACAEKVLQAVDGGFIVMGTSFGGHVAREAALAAPDRVKGLWIIGAGAGAIANRQAGLERSGKLRGGREEEVYQQFHKMITHLPGERGPWAADEFLRMARRSDPQKVALQADALALRPDRWNDLGRPESADRPGVRVVTETRLESRPLSCSLATAFARRPVDLVVSAAKRAAQLRLTDKPSSEKKS